MTVNKDEAKQAALHTLIRLAQSDIPSWIDMDNVQVDGYKHRSLIEVVRYVLGCKATCQTISSRHAKSYTPRSSCVRQARNDSLLSSGCSPALRFSHPQMWLINVLRDRCWYDYGTGTHKELLFFSVALGRLLDG